MIRKSKRIMTAFMAVIMLISTLIPLSASAADVTMDLSKAEVSWDYTLTDEEVEPLSGQNLLTNSKLRTVIELPPALEGASAISADATYDFSYSN